MLLDLSTFHDALKFPSSMKSVPVSPLKDDKRSFFVFRILAVRGAMVQRLRDLRRVGVFGEHHAHVFHLPGSLLGHPEPVENTAHLDQTNGRFQDRGCLAARHAGLQFHYGIR